MGSSSRSASRPSQSARQRTGRETSAARPVMFGYWGDDEAPCAITEENDMWRRISWHPIHQVDEVLMGYRMGDLSTSHQRYERRYFYDLRHFVKNAARHAA